MINSNLFKEELDAEWIQLISEAKNLGMNLQEVREFIQKEGLLNLENPNHSL